MKYYINLDKDYNIIAGSREEKSGFQEVSFVPAVGTNFNIYEEDGSRKPLEHCVLNKWIEQPVGYKIEGETFVEMSQVEKIEAGLVEMPDGMEIIDGELKAKSELQKILDGDIEMPKGKKWNSKKTALLDKTLREQFTSKEITEAEYASIIRGQRDSYLAAADKFTAMFTDGVFTPEQYEPYKQYRQYLREIPNSTGFPKVDVLSFEKWNK